MSAPYLVTSHRHFCRSCRRDVEDEESVVNEDGFHVHLGCGTVLEFQGATLPSGSGRSTGAELGMLHGSHGCEAEWLAEQMAILAGLPGGGAPSGYGGRGQAKRQKNTAGQGSDGRAEALAILSEESAQAQQPIQPTRSRPGQVRERGLQGEASGKQRKGDESWGNYQGT
eukprot:TRINITY_DN70658_c0_g1_i1.p2 TRINITY_DN70658_c0_g1~~TRINITY_DN70658_c0_g1_i1.p2  ORF type:complete len:170 (-),score=24.73 TRINITY_DN70658_c0_g1_i1:185-694(-)